MDPKFVYIEDDTTSFLAANGGALTALLVGLPDILPLVDFPLPTYPMWIYFLGLIFAFGAKSIIQIQNDDMRQREKLQNHRNWAITASESPDMTEELSKQLDAVWEKLAALHGRLLKEHHGPILDKARASFYFASGLSFLTATGSIIWLAGYAKTPAG